MPISHTSAWEVTLSLSDALIVPVTCVTYRIAFSVTEMLYSPQHPTPHGVVAGLAVTLPASAPPVKQRFANIQSDPDSRRDDHTLFIWGCNSAEWTKFSSVHLSEWRRLHGLCGEWIVSKKFVHPHPIYLVGRVWYNPQSVCLKNW